MKNEILTPASPRWVDFMVELTGPDYLDFHYPHMRPANSPSLYHSFAGIVWLCSHNDAKPVARLVLAGMAGVDVDGTLAQWPTQCDCGLVFNVGNEEGDDQMDNEWDKYEEA